MCANEGISGRTAAITEQSTRPMHKETNWLQPASVDVLVRVMDVSSPMPWLIFKRENSEYLNKSPITCFVNEFSPKASKHGLCSLSCHSPQE